MKGIFVTGTDTGVGKTIITGLLARYLSDKGYNVITQKWIQTGSRDRLASDIKLHLKIMQQKKNNIKDYLSYAAPYTFKYAYSPHLASRMEKRSIEADKIRRSFRLLSKEFDVVLVEGIGGALVPFSNKHLVIDMVKKLDLPVLVVVHNKLGAINHSLLTIEALRTRGIKILGLVFNNRDKEDGLILRDNPRIIKMLSGEKILGTLPKAGNQDELYKSFIPIGKQILRQLLQNG